MRIIWLKSDYIAPPDSGGKIRTYNLLRELNQLCEVEYVSFKPTATPNQEPEILACARRVHTLVRAEEVKAGPKFYARVLAAVPGRLPYIVRKYRDARFQEYQRARLQDHIRSRESVIVCDFLEMAENVAWNLEVPKILFQHNVESVIWDRYFRTETHPLKRMYFDFERRRMARYEREACDRFDLVLTVTETDLNRLRHDMGVRAPMMMIETGVDTDYFQPRDDDVSVSGQLLFLGSLDWMPNIDGLNWFVSEVYPLIRQQCSDVSLRIVGRRPVPAIRRLADEDSSIQVLGDVADVRPYIADCDLFLVPLRVGSGSRLKIFEAMAMRKAVVATRIGAEGLPVRDQQEIALADSPVDFSRQVVDLLRDPDHKRMLAEKGFQLVTTNHHWKRIAKEFYEACRRLVA